MPAADSPSAAAPVPARAKCLVSQVDCGDICTYASVFEQMGVGTIVLNTAEREIVFHNRTADQLCASAVIAIDYHSLIEQFVSTRATENDNPNRLFTPINIGPRILGHAVRQVEPDQIWLFLRDLTERARLESIAAAVETMNNLGYVFSSVRHEIGNPLNSMKVALTTLRSSLDRFPPPQIAAYVERCLADLGRIEFLLRSLKTFNMYEQVELEQVDVASLVATFFSLAEPDSRQRGIAMSQQISSDVGWAQADARALQQALLNVLSNAVDAVEGKSGAQITISAFAADKLVHIMLHDNGQGIPDDRREELFKPFFTTKPNGTGLGLVNARRLLAMMRGTIDIRSRPGIGTTVDLTIPALSR